MFVKGLSTKARAGANAGSTGAGASQHDVAHALLAALERLT